MTYVNPLTESWRQGRTTFGIWCSLPTSVSAEFAAGAGYDYACVDMQHGAIGYTAAVPMLQAVAATGAAPVARVAANNQAEIMKILDGGAVGVVVPLVSTPEEAAQAVAACRYPPTGVRSYGPVRASVVTGSRDPRELEKVVCLVMVETAEGLANVDEIAATPGLDGIYVGPSDLSLALGLPPGYERPEQEHIDAIERIRTACELHGIVAGIQCDTGALAARRAQEGFAMITVGNEAAFMRSLAASELSEARGGSGG